MKLLLGLVLMMFVGGNVMADTHKHCFHYTVQENQKSNATEIFKECCECHKKFNLDGKEQ